MRPRPKKSLPDAPAKTIPSSKLPASAPDGQIMVNASKYARNAVLTAFEMIGGTPAFADWAAMNREKFYTGPFAKTIQRDVEHNVGEGVEELLDRLDAKKQVEMEDEMTIDAEFEMVGDAYADAGTE